MRGHISRTIAVAAAGVLLATSAQAQKQKHKDKERAERIRREERDRRVIIGESHGDIVRIDRGRRIPPGLAKKPGGMPPGQYKKHYGVYEGSNVLSDIFRRRGYRVVRVAPVGDSRYVYYRYGNGDIARAIVSPGTDRLAFTNVPASILRAVLESLY